MSQTRAAPELGGCGSFAAFFALRVHRHASSGEGEQEQD
jgi:hypothetical protein